MDKSAIKFKVRDLLRDSGLITNELAKKAVKVSDIDNIINNIIKNNVILLDSKIVSKVMSGDYSVTNPPDKTNIVGKVLINILNAVYVDKKLPEYIIMNTSISNSGDNVRLVCSLSDNSRRVVTDAGKITFIGEVSDNKLFMMPMFEIDETGIKNLNNKYLIDGNIYVYPPVSKAGIYVITVNVNRFEDNEYTQKKNNVMYRIRRNMDSDIEMASLSDFNIATLVDMHNTQDDYFMYRNVIEVDKKSLTDDVYIRCGNNIYGPYKYKDINNRKVVMAQKYRVNVYRNVNIEDKIIHTSYGESFKIIYTNNLYGYSNEVIDAMPREKFESVLFDLLEKTDISKDEAFNLLDKIESIDDKDIYDELFADRLNGVCIELQSKADINNISESIRNMIADRNGIGNTLIDDIVKDDRCIDRIKECVNYKNKIESLKSSVNELEEKKIKCDKLDEDIKEKENKLKELSDTFEACLTYKDFINSYNLLKDEYNDLSNSIVELDKVLNDKLDGITPDSEIAKKLVDKRLDEIINKQKEIEDRDNIRKENERNNNQYRKKEVKEDVLNYIVNSIKAKRPNLTHNEIVNIMLCITQNYMTMFMGEPGVGKTTLCEIINDVICGGERCNILTVNKGWTNKNDLIGYYNPLTGDVGTSNYDIYSALKTLSNENKNSKYPWYITLDEANLSPMEYYWCDFINFANKLDNKIVGDIDIGNGNKLVIPNTLRFIATLNSDETTEKISPRMIDRSWIIKLKSKDVYKNLIGKKGGKINSIQGIVSQDNLENIFGANEITDESIKMIDILIKDIKPLSDIGIGMNQRNQNDILKYISKAKDLFEKSEYYDDKKFEILDYVMAQKILPKIDSNFGTEYEVLSKFNKNNRNKYPMSTEIVSDILTYGRQMMGNYNYFM